MKNKEVDCRFDTKSGSRDFHSRRRAFIIYNDEVNFLEEGSSLSHWEFAQIKFPEITKEIFVELTRGYFMDNEVVFYKGNFCYDDGVIAEGLKHVGNIRHFVGSDEVIKIYFGTKVGKPGEIWEKDLYYGECLSDNTIVTD